MRKLKYIAFLHFTILFTILSNYTFGQQGMYVEIIANPGMSMGGDYQIETNNGYQVSWVSMQKSFTFGLNAGTAIGYNFNEHIGLSLNILYSIQGQNYNDYTYSQFGVPYSYTWKRKVSLNYINIPLLFKYMLSIDKQLSFIGSIGVYTGILLNYKDEESFIISNVGRINSIASGTNYTSTIDGNIFTTHSNNAVFLSKPYNSIDFGGIIETGFQYSISDKISIPIMLNYQIGFIDIKNKESMFTYTNSTTAYPFWGDPADNNPNSTLSYHNSFLGLKIGIKINLNK